VLNRELFNRRPPSQSPHIIIVIITSFSVMN